jgi:hypothetical protein
VASSGTLPSSSVALHHYDEPASIMSLLTFAYLIKCEYHRTLLNLHKIVMVNIQQARAANFACCIFALILLLVHLGLSLLYGKGHVDAVSWFCIVSILFVIARIVVNTILLGNVTAHDVLNFGLDNSNPAEVKLASILSLVTRTIGTAIYWLQVCILLLFYSRIMGHFSWTKKVIKACWVLLPLTFIAVVLVTFLECRPFSLYWQLSPPAGSCTNAYAQLLLQGFSNMFLDLMVVVVSLPLLLKWQHRTVSQNIRVGILFCCGTLCVIITCLRISQVVRGRSTQATRSLWASVQLLISTFVANTPFIYGTSRLILSNWHQRPERVDIDQQRSCEES